MCQVPKYSNILLIFSLQNSDKMLCMTNLVSSFTEIGLQDYIIFRSLNCKTTHLRKPKLHLGMLIPRKCGILMEMISFRHKHTHNCHTPTHPRYIPLFLRKIFFPNPVHITLWFKIHCRCMRYDDSCLICKPSC